MVERHNLSRGPVGYVFDLILAVIARACILLCFSEYIFFNEGPVLEFLGHGAITAKLGTVVELVAFYCLPASLLLVLEPKMTSWPRVIAAGAFIGWSIEAAMVPAVYEYPPLSYFWTSVFWHALVDVAFGCVILRQVFAQGAIVSRVIWVIGLAIAGTVWSTWAWAEVSLTRHAILELTALIAALLFIGYLGAGRFYPQPVGRVMIRIAIGANIAFGILWGVGFVPWSLGLAVLIAVNTAAFLAMSDGAITLSANKVGLPQLAPLVLYIPVGSVSYEALVHIDQSAVIGEIMILIMVIVGAGVYLLTLGSALRDWRNRQPR